MSRCLTKEGRRAGLTPLVEADMMGCRYLAEYNARVEAGKKDHITERLLEKSQFWLDRLNRLNSNL